MSNNDVESKLDYRSFMLAMKIFYELLGAFKVLGSAS